MSTVRLLRNAGIIVGIGLSLTAFADNSIDAALKAAGLTQTDSPDQRMTKILTLLNDQHYYFPKGPPTQLAPPFDNPYHLDSLRTPQEILSQKIGGACGSAALATAAMLTRSGISPDDIRVVGAVVDKDYSEICGKAGEPRIEHPHSGASGHVFVMMRFPGNHWYMVNTTDGAADYHKVEVPSPDALTQQMAKGPTSVPIEVYSHLLDNPHTKDIFGSGLTIFKIWKLDEYPKHTFEERYNLIASGKVSDGNGAVGPSRVCRYDATKLAEQGAKDILEYSMKPKDCNCHL